MSTTALCLTPNGPAIGPGINKQPGEAVLARSQESKNP